MKKLLPSLCFATFLLVPLLSDAQGITDIGNTSALITLEPAFPEPGQEVTAQIENVFGDRAGALITWRLGDRIMSEATGRVFTFTAGPAGTTMNVSAALELPNGQVERAETVVTPIYLDLIVEPQTHTPDFYTGRGLATPGSMVNVSALLFGRNETPQNLIYTWRMNGTVLGGSGIRGGSRTSFEMPQDTRVLLEVTVTNLSGELVGRKTELLLNARPELVFYQDHTLYGLIPLSLRDRFLGSNTVTIQAVPYNLDSEVYNDADVIEWELDGRNIPNSANNPYQLTINSNGSGVSRVGFRVQSTTEFLQNARANVQVFY